MTPFQAALKGVREISFAVVAMTLTLAAVFAPLAFTPGRTGRLFSEFALTLAGAVLVSGFVALTLTPMMCSKLLRHNPSADALRPRHGEPAGRPDPRLYTRVLRWTLAHRWLVLLVMLASAGGSWWLFSTRQERALADGRPRRHRRCRSAPPTAPRWSTPRATWTRIDAIAAQYPEFDRRFMFVGGGQVSSAFGVLRTVDWTERDITTQELARELLPQVRPLPGVTAFPVTPPSLGQGFRSQPLNYVIVSGDSYENMARAAQAMIAEMQKNPGIVQPDSDLQLNKPEIFMEVDRARAADMGVSVESVARTVETMLGGRVVTRYKRDAEQYDVMVQTEGRGRATPEDIEKLFVRGRGDTMVPLSVAGQGARGGEPARAEPLQPAALGHHHRQPGAGLFAGRGAGLHGRDGGARAAGGLRHRTQRREPRIPGLVGRARAWSSCWRCCSSSWCWRRSSRASSTPS